MKRSERLPFSLHVKKTVNKFYILYRRKQFATGLEATEENRRIALTKGWEIYDRHVRAEVMPERRGRTTFEGAFKEFLSSHGANKSKKTIAAYNEAFKAIISTPGLKVSEAAIEDQIRYAVKTKKHIKNGWDNYRRSFTTFLNWCVRKKILPGKIVIIDYFPKPKPKPIRIYTTAEYEKIITAAFQADNEFGVLLSVFFLTGFRIHEILELRRAQISGVQIEMESKDERRAETFPITPELRRLFDSVPVRSDGKVFRWGNPGALRHRFYRLLESIGIERNGRSMHEMRKTFISNLANNDVDIRIAAELARCSVAVMIKHYTLLSHENKKKTLERIFVPLPAAENLQQIYNNQTDGNRQKPTKRRPRLKIAAKKKP